MKRKVFFLLLTFIVSLASAQQPGFLLNESEYFVNGGVDVMAFQDIYPEGHQGGVAIIMHGMRIATNGDLRLDSYPGDPRFPGRIPSRSA